MKLHVHKLYGSSILPTRATKGSAGLDIYAHSSHVVYAGETALVKTGIAVEIPYRFEGQVRGRSGLSFVGVHVHLGTIDSDYRGEVGVIVSNFGERPFEVKPGDRIAQLVIAPVAMVEPVEVEALTATERGSGGFGSTGT